MDVNVDTHSCLLAFSFCTWDNSSLVSDVCRVGWQELADQSEYECLSPKIPAWCVRQQSARHARATLHSLGSLRRKAFLGTWAFWMNSALLLSSKGHGEKTLCSQVRMCRQSCFYSVKFNSKHFPAFPDSPSLWVPLSPGVIWSSTSARYPTTNKAEANAHQKYLKWHAWDPDGQSDMSEKSKVFQGFLENAQ